MHIDMFLFKIKYLKSFFMIFIFNHFDWQSLYQPCLLSAAETSVLFEASELGMLSTEEPPLHVPSLASVGLLLPDSSWGLAHLSL